MLCQFYSFDRPYLERLRRGDGQTEKHFTDYFGRLIQLRLGSRFDSRAVIDDIRQETFLRVWIALRKDGAIRHPERFGAFVTSVCKNVVREYLRRSSKEDHSEDDLAAGLPDKTAGAADILALNESRRYIERVLAELPAKPRRLIRRVFFEECNKDDLCRDLGVGRDYLRVLLHRATRELRHRYFEEVRTEAQRRSAKLPLRVVSKCLTVRLQPEKSADVIHGKVARAPGNGASLYSRVRSSTRKSSGYVLLQRDFSPRQNCDA